MLKNVLAIIPAHNEADAIAKCVASLHDQTVPPSNILVCSDNSTDDTVRVASEAGAVVFETLGNSGLRAGAINQGLERMLPTLDDADAVLVMDADTYLAPDFIERAVKRLRGGIGGVTGMIRGDEASSKGLLGMFQAMEYARVQRQRSRTGQLDNLAGAASLYRVAALRDVVARRGEVYRTGELTEDLELTLALKRLGWGIDFCKAECYTELETTWSGLWRQRMRWQLGGLAVMRRYGWSQRWWHLFWTQLTTHLSIAVMGLALVLYSSLAFQHVNFQPWWLLLLPLIAVDQLVTTWRVPGWRARLVAASILPVALYSAGQAVVYVAALGRFACGKHSVAWGGETSALH